MDPTNNTQPPVEQKPQQPPIEQLPQPAASGPGRRKTAKWGIVAAIVVVFLAAAAFIRHTSSPSQPSTTAQKAMTAQVEITADGFSPQTLSVPAGTKVTWVNKDSSPHRVASDPYPENTGLPGLDSKDTPLGPDATYSYTFKAVGNFTYHDQYKPTTDGQIIVK
jgi:plastocyanin